MSEDFISMFYRYVVSQMILQFIKIIYHELHGIYLGFWHADMNVDELFEATAQAMLAAMERDAASGWGVVIYTITKDKVNMKTIKARMD